MKTGGGMQRHADTARAERAGGGYRLILGFVLAAFTGCSGTEPTGPSAGAIAVTTSTSGPADPDGYRLLLDGVQAVSIGAAERAVLPDIPAGDHRVTLIGVARQCVVVGDNPLQVTVRASTMEEVGFEITCGAALGTLRVLTRTTGESLDPDGYAATVDGVTRLIQANDRATFRDLAAGDHLVELTELASNCGIDGSNMRTAALPPEQTIDVTFDIHCDRVPATLLVRIVTTGPAPDPDGYLLSIDGAAGVAVDPTASLTRPTAVGATHELLLSGLAPFCYTEDHTRLEIRVTGESAEASFEVICSGVPSAGRILYSAPVGAETHVFAMHPDGTGSADLTPGMGAYAGRWSPDGARIVFERYQDPQTEVWIMRADGGESRRLASGSQPGWSPDGTRIVFVQGGAITVMNADGSGVRALTINQRAAEPDWSPDGTVVVYAAENLSRCALLPTWDVVCAWDLRAIDADGSNPRHLTVARSGYSRDRSPAWSPDGSRIAFWRSSVGFPRPDGSLYLTAPDGSEETPLDIPGGAYAAYPVWSPDGEAVAFAIRSASATELNIGLMSRHGGDPVVYPSPAEQVPTSWR